MSSGIRILPPSFLTTSICNFLLTPNLFCSVLSFSHSCAATQSELFRTETIKRCLNPVFGKTVRSELLPRSLLKEGCLKLRVIDEERYANDVCLGEVAIALRKISPLGKGEEFFEAVSAPEKMKKKKDSTDSKMMECENGESSSSATSAVPQIRVNGAEKSLDEELVVAEAGEQPGSQISTYTLFPIKEVSEKGGGEWKRMRLKRRDKRKGIKVVECTAVLN